MKIIRLTHAKYGRDPDRLASLGVSLGRGNVRTSRIGADNCSVILLASTDFDTAHFENGIADIRPYLRDLEKITEITADIISTSLSTSRSLSSPTPCAALVPATESEKNLIADFKSWCIAEKPTCFPSADLSFDFAENMNVIGDRIDGLPLIAAISCHSTSIGKLHDIMRLFERAFGVSDKRLINPLFKFLLSGFGQYSHKEVHRWITEVRHPATHADKRQDFLLERDVYSFIPRMHQAAFDVYFNKENWRSPDDNRVLRWKPSVFITTEQSEINAVKGRDWKVTMSFLDQFGSYPRNLNAIFNPPPNNWVFPPSPATIGAPPMIVHAEDFNYVNSLTHAKIQSPPLTAPTPPAADPPAGNS